MVDEIAFVVDQHLLAGRRPFGVALHDVVVVETDHLAGAAQVAGQLVVESLQPETGDEIDLGSPGQKAVLALLLQHLQRQILVDPVQAGAREDGHGHGADHVADETPPAMMQAGNGLRQKDDGQDRGQKVQRPVALS